MDPFPVRRVALYKHGVGYFEREAQVRGAQAVTLTFPEREVSDVLKSLTVADLGGGVVTAVSYDAAPPAARLLADIALSVPDSGSLAGLLPQLKGARVAVTPTAEATVEGVLLGLDTVEVAAEGRAFEQVRVAIVADGGAVQTFPLAGVSVAFLDDSVRRDLDSYLRTSLAGKTKNARTFTLYTEGEGDRALRVGYLRETPVWKATYRVLLADSPDEKPTLQGWAVVDNTSDDDWVDVELTLVAGLPVSFTHDLYTPRYVRRPVVTVQETSGVLPPTAEAGFDQDADEGVQSVDSMLVEFTETAVAPAARSRRAAPLALRGLAAPAAPAAPSTVRHETRERQLGDLFEYAVDRPVTVRRNQSALVPIVLTPFSGRPVLLYQKAARAQNPVRCVEFENTTGLTLEGGPVLVLEHGSYAGEAMLDTLKPADTRLVGYAVDLGVRVTDSIDSRTEQVTSVVIRHGRAKITSAVVMVTTYTFAVGGPAGRKPETLYVDHPRGDEFGLTAPDKPHETTENFWRFKLALPASGPVKFAVETRRPVIERVAVLSNAEATIAVWVTRKLIDAATDKAIRALFAIQQKRGELRERVKTLDKERERIHAEQKRVRENLSALGERTSEQKLRERLVKTLTEQEDRLAALELESKAAADAAEALTCELDAKAEALEYDGARKS